VEHTSERKFQSRLLISILIVCTEIISSPNHSVIIGLTLSTSPPTLSSSPREPFYIVVTARILKSPRPDQSVTLQTHPSPLAGLNNRSFENIICTTGPDKRFKIFPEYHLHHIVDREDLRGSWTFVTIPPPGQGYYSVKHEVPRDEIKAANVQKERDIALF
jgi:hypothetical protein